MSSFSPGASYILLSIQSPTRTDIFEPCTNPGRPRITTVEVFIMMSNVFRCVVIFYKERKIEFGTSPFDDTHIRVLSRPTSNLVEIQICLEESSRSQRPWMSISQVLKWLARSLLREMKGSEAQSTLPPLVSNTIPRSDQYFEITEIDEKHDIFPWDLGRRLWLLTQRDIEVARGNFWERYSSRECSWRRS